jgi:hypothetical protein
VKTFCGVNCDESDIVDPSSSSDSFCAHSSISSSSSTLFRAHSSTSSYSSDLVCVCTFIRLTAFIRSSCVCIRPSQCLHPIPSVPIHPSRPHHPHSSVLIHPPPRTHPISSVCAHSSVCLPSSDLLCVHSSISVSSSDSACTIIPLDDVIRFLVNTWLTHTNLSTYHTILECVLPE